ncbi:MAG: carboxypeptidase-like regulatory domain-containing protein, partial [Sphingobacterium sp.]
MRKECLLLLAMSAALSPSVIQAKIPIKVFHISNDFRLQPTEIRGSVISAETNEPIAGVTVSVKGKNKSTATDDQGNFSIEVNQGDQL